MGFCHNWALLRIPGGHFFFPWAVFIVQKASGSSGWSVHAAFTCSGPASPQCCFLTVLFPPFLQPAPSRAAGRADWLSRSSLSWLRPAAVPAPPEAAAVSGQRAIICWEWRGERGSWRCMSNSLPSVMGLTSDLSSFEESECFDNCEIIWP